MKRILACILICALLLSGCGIMSERLREPVTFYYLRHGLNELRPGEDIFVPEIREAAGHRHDLSYLMALYLIGPTNEELSVPLPRGTRISVSTGDDGDILLKLSEPAKAMTDIEYALACTCLSMTCLELTGAPSITITCGERSVTMNRASLLLGDHTTDKTLEETP